MSYVVNRFLVRAVDELLQMRRKMHLLAGIDDVHELWLERGAANEETIDVGLLGQLLGIGGRHRATVLNAQTVGHILRDVLCQPLSQEGVHLLGLQSENLKVRA